MLVKDVRGDVMVHAAGLPIPVLAHGVNCVGVMGAGFAAQAAKAWPDMYEQYQHVCRSGALDPGGFYAWPTARGGWVYNLATQDKPGKCARIEWVEQAAASMARHALSLGMRRIASVRIGCGIGGLEWEQVRSALQRIDSEVELLVADGRT